MGALGILSTDHNGGRHFFFPGNFITWLYNTNMDDLDDECQFFFLC